MDKFEITNHCVSILFGAHETTSSLIANAIHQLLSNPDQLSLLEQDESLIPSAVEEVLRFDPPAKLTARVCLHDIRVGDIDFSNQEKIMIYFNCINRDPAIYTDPHQFLITRKEKRHISFGYGVHACFGAALAKMQAEVVLVKLIPLLKNKKIKSLSWIESMVFRKMDEFVIVEQEARHT
jgi:cytochrome P450